MQRREEVSDPSLQRKLSLLLALMGHGSCPTETDTGTPPELHQRMADDGSGV